MEGVESICFVLFCFVLFLFVLFCFVLFCFVCLFVFFFGFLLFVCLFCFVLFCFVMFCFVLFCFWLCFFLGCFLFVFVCLFCFVLFCLFWFCLLVCLFVCLFVVFACHILKRLKFISGVPNWKFLPGKKSKNGEFSNLAPPLNSHLVTPLIVSSHVLRQW